MKFQAQAPPDTEFLAILENCGETKCDLSKRTASGIAHVSRIFFRAMAHNSDISKLSAGNRAQQQTVSGQPCTRANCHLSTLTAGNYLLAGEVPVNRTVDRETTC